MVRYIQQVLDHIHVDLAYQDGIVLTILQSSDLQHPLHVLDVLFGVVLARIKRVNLVQFAQQSVVDICVFRRANLAVAHESVGAKQVFLTVLFGPKVVNVGNVEFLVDFNVLDLEQRYQSSKANDESSRFQA